MNTLLLSSPPFTASVSVFVAAFFGIFGKSRHRETDRTGTTEEHIPFESLFSLIGDPVFLIAISPYDFPEQIVEANEAASEVYGYTLSEFRGLTLSDLLKPDKDSVRILKERFPMFLQTGRFRGESVHISKSGREFPIEFSARLVVKDGQRFNLTLIRDISERKRLEEEKAKEKEWYETLFFLIDEPAILFELDPGDAPDRVVEVNSAAIRTYGYSRDVFLTLSSKDLVSPNADPRLLSVANATLREHGLCHFDSIHRNRARADLFIETSARLFEKDGKRYALHLNRDITARKRAEETHGALAEAERKVLAGENFRPVIDAFCRELGRIFPSMDVGLYKKSPNGKAELLAGGYTYRLKTLSLDNPPEEDGAVATSIKTGKTRIFDIQDPAYPEELRAVLREMGVRYTWSIPLFLKKEVHGALAFVTAEEFPPVFEDILLLEGLSGRIALLYGLGQEQREIRMGYDALQAVTEAISIVEQNGEIRWVNNAFLTLTGYMREEIVGTSPQRIASDPRISALYQGLWAAISSGQTFESEILNRRKDGSLYVAHELITPLLNEEGQVARYIEIQRDITRTKENEIRMWRLANYDVLTGLPNRNLLRSMIQSALDTAAPTGEKVGLLYLDLDHFKEVNDTLGHDAGDRFLQLVSERLCLSIHMSDVIGRLGGDEFVVVRPAGRDSEDILEFGRGILSCFSEPFVLDGKSIQIACSAGIVLYPDNGSDAETLLRKADIALYQAKSRGRGRLQMFETLHENAVQAKVNLSQELRSAVEKKQFVLHYQPIVDLRTGTIGGVEALIRWKKDDGSVVHPNHFIPLTEETGLIHPLGDWIFDEACRQMNEWKEMGVEPGKVAINLSPVQLSEPEFIEKARALLNKWGLSDKSAGLSFEITESRALGVESVEKLSSLRKMGIRIALDDFGTGFSSLSFLKGFPVDTLKIDQSFMSDIGTGVNDRTIIKAIVMMAKNLGLRVIAEGVETEAQVDFLKDAGCDAVQGFYYYRPSPPDEIARLISAQNVTLRQSNVSGRLK